MFRNPDTQTQQTDPRRGSIVQQLLGVVGEEEYFARQEVERAQVLAGERRSNLDAQDQERERAFHFMKCPKCGMQLEEIAFGDVRVDRCFACDGLWLDKGEVDLIRGKESGFMARLLSVFGS